MLEDDSILVMAAIPATLPPVPAHEVFTADQWVVLLSICEVFMPSLTSSALGEVVYKQARDRVSSICPHTTDDEVIDRYLRETVVNDENFQESIRQRFVAYTPKAQVEGMAFLLSALRTKLGSLVMTGSTVPLHSHSLQDRTRIVLGWANAYTAPLRALFQATEFLTKATWLAQSSSLHNILDYPKVPKDITRHASYEFDFLDFSNEPADHLIEVNADVIIIGSGCGAGVVAEFLSSHLSSLHPKPRIIVVEKSYHFPNSHFPMDQSAAGVNLQEGGGGILADDGSIAVLAGSTWGGGGTINWSASLQPQHYVRQEWATKNNLPFVLSKEFQACIDQVCDKMGVCKATDAEGLAKIEHSFANAALLEGSRRLGLTAKVVPQNTKGERHYCGRCNFGCAGALKQGPATLWLPAAAEKGAEFIEGCLVERILWEGAALEGGQATGVLATWTSRARDITRKLRITAKQIVVSSGTLHSPLLLHRSGLTPSFNKHIGSNLHLHPVLPVHATFAERTDPWDGAILTAAMTSLENMDGRGHGVKLEIMLGTPDMAGTMLPVRPHLSLDASKEDTVFEAALDYRLRIARHGHGFSLITMQRDHAEDSNLKKSYVYGIEEDPRFVKINYTPSVTDRKHLLAGALMAARVHYAVGAQTIEMCTPSIDMFQRPSAHATASSEDTGLDDAAFESWLADIESQGIKLLDPKFTRLGSAHQMSTCRMSASRADGAVDPSGKVWGTNNVWLADASILPSASGVNPMVSTMGLSLHVAKCIARCIEETWH